MCILNKRILHRWPSGYSVAFEKQERRVRRVRTLLLREEMVRIKFALLLSLQNDRTCVLKVFSKRVNFKTHVWFPYIAQARTKGLTILTQCICQVSSLCSMFTVRRLYCLCVNIYLIFDPGWMLAEDVFWRVCLHAPVGRSERDHFRRWPAPRQVWGYHGRWGPLRLDCHQHWSHQWYVQPLWQIDVYQQNVFRRGRKEAENYVSNQNSF